MSQEWFNAHDIKISAVEPYWFHDGYNNVGDIVMCACRQHTPFRTSVTNIDAAVTIELPVIAYKSL